MNDDSNQNHEPTLADLHRALERSWKAITALADEVCLMADEGYDATAAAIGEDKAKLMAQMLAKHITYDALARAGKIGQLKQPLTTDEIKRRFLNP